MIHRRRVKGQPRGFRGQPRDNLGTTLSPLPVTPIPTSLSFSKRKENVVREEVVEVGVGGTVRTESLVDPETAEVVPEVTYCVTAQVLVESQRLSPGCPGCPPEPQRLSTPDSDVAPEDDETEPRPEPDVDVDAFLAACREKHRGALEVRTRTIRCRE